MGEKLSSLYDFVAKDTGHYQLLVVGDVMLDKYYYGEVTRISPEAPVPVTHVTRVRETLGGAANVAHNLALMGAQVSIAGFVGDDYHCQSLMDKFIACGIDYRGIVHTSSPTTAKLRVIGGHQQMLRLDFEETAPVAEPYAERLLNYVEKKLADGLDCLVISDYAKGACTEDTCSAIIAACKAGGVPIVIDPKGSDWTKYIGADYITPNLKEINQVVAPPIQNEDTAVTKAAGYLRDRYQINNILATRSECGMSRIGGHTVCHIPTRAQEVFDVSGAGDTVLAVFSLALAGGIEPSEAAYLANLAASVVVAKLGTYAVSRAELLQVLGQMKEETGGGRGK